MVIVILILAPILPLWFMLDVSGNRDYSFPRWREWEQVTIGMILRAYVISIGLALVLPVIIAIGSWCALLKIYELVRAWCMGQRINWWQT